MSNNNTVPFADLSRSYLPLKNEINQAIQKVIDSSAFILGKEVEKFDEALHHRAIKAMYISELEDFFNEVDDGDNLGF